MQINGINRPSVRERLVGFSDFELVDDLHMIGAVSVGTASFSGVFGNGSLSEVAVQRTIERLHHRGVSFALDDFGTGFSSLTSLRRFPIDKIKIDRSFVSNVGSTVDATIVHAVVSIGRALGLKVVAEGVETVEHQRFVAAAGVHAMQGYLFARPMRNTQVTAFVAEFDGRFRTPASAIR